MEIKKPLDSVNAVVFGTEAGPGRLEFRTQQRRPRGARKAEVAWRWQGSSGPTLPFRKSQCVCDSTLSTRLAS